MTEIITYTDLLKTNEQVTFIICCLSQKRLSPTNINESYIYRVRERGSRSLEAAPQALWVSIAPRSALKGEVAICTNKEFTPSMFIFTLTCHKT